jgi:hypothetical protein
MRVLVRFGMLFTLMLAACKPSGRAPVALSSEQTEDRSEIPVNAVTDETLERLIADLRSDDEAVQKQAKQNLDNLRRVKLSVSQGIGVLKAAAEPFPNQSKWEDLATDLMQLAENSPAAEFTPVIKDLFHRYSDHGKGLALSILLALESRDGDLAYMELMRQHAPKEAIPYLVIGGLQRTPRNADIFFPELLEFASIKKYADSIYRLSLAYCEAGLLRPATLKPFADKVLHDYRELAAELRPKQRKQGIAWMWEGKYSDDRHKAGVILDLLGYFPAGVVESDLRDALQYQDAHLIHYALLSLLRLGKTVDAKHLEFVADSSEMRNFLYDALHQLRKPGLFPAKYRTQGAFAESDMVNWLVFPTELDRVPDEIELMKVVSVDTGLKDGIYDYYLFRFRTFEPHWNAKNGWEAGVSGPFARKDSPTTRALGDTFSSFAKWESKKPDEHVGDIRELMERWREYHSKNSK